MAFSKASIIAIAMVCHAANAAYCRSLGDDSQKPWGEAPDWQKASAVAGVEFHLANPDAGDAASHESWMAAKVADGWVYGEVKDEEAKTHPCIVEFDKLPPEQQFKDTLFRSIVHGAIPGVGELASQNDRLQEELAQANTDLAAVTAERDALKAAADAAAAAPKARGAKAPKARNCGPVVNSDGEEVPTPKPRDLHELIQVANKVEVLFSADGKKESTKLAAQEISGSAWSVRESGLVLTLDLAVRGPATIAGYGLMLDGELVAYRERFEVLKIADGANASLAGDVVF